MSKVVELELRLQRYKDARRTIADVVKLTRKSVELTREQRHEKIASLNASRQQIRAQEQATQRRLALERRAQALRGRSTSGFSRLGGRLSGAGGRIASVNSLIDLGRNAADLVSDESLDGAAIDALPQAIDLAADAAASLGPIGQVVSAVTKIVNNTVVGPAIRAYTDQVNRKLRALDQQITRRTERALQRFEQRIAEDPRFANKLAELNNESRRAYQAISGRAGLIPREQGLLEF